MNCPLCLTSNPSLFCHVQSRDFYRCELCDFVHVPAPYWLPEEDEKARYLNHKNERTNNGYVDYLLVLVAKVEMYAVPKAMGLDFGCGHTPVLGELLRERGYSCIDYDPFFYPESELSLFKDSFDFIVICEAAEHFKEPLLEWHKIADLLKSSGTVAVSTKTVQNHSVANEFKDWWYLRDSTHISFYSQRSVEFLAKRIGALILEFSSNGFVLKKIV